MGKIEKNMYARTKNNGICKLCREFHEDSVDVGIGVFPEIDGFFIDKEEISYIEKEDIIKSSKNIIDLIEVGDYVNGQKVGYVDECIGAMREYYYDYEDINKDCGHWQEEIETILTKEQYENNCYKLEE